MIFRIFCAGVANSVCRMITDEFAKKHPELEIDLEVGGSNKGISNLLNGKSYDVMILADNSNIDQQMMPEHVSGYHIWGGNSMAIKGEGINDDNWLDILLHRDIELKHMNPYDDPGGYRAVMAMKLADYYEEGLSDKFFSIGGYHGLDKDFYKEFKLIAEDKEDKSYMILYKSVAAASGDDYVELPGVMNLGDPQYEKEYNSVSFVIGTGEKIVGTTIYHAILMPLSAENKELAKEYIEDYLALDFTAYGFTGVRRTVGIV